MERQDLGQSWFLRAPRNHTICAYYRTCRINISLLARDVWNQLILRSVKLRTFPLSGWGTSTHLSVTLEYVGTFYCHIFYVNFPILTVFCILRWQNSKLGTFFNWRDPYSRNSRFVGAPTTKAPSNPSFRGPLLDKKKIIGKRKSLNVYRDCSWEARGGGKCPLTWVF